MFLNRALKKKYLPDIILYLCIALFVVYFTHLSFARHDNFYSLRLDLGNMDQTVWNVVHGNGFTLTDPMGEKQMSRTGIHADFLLILLAPLYLIWSNPKMLLLVQVVVVSLGALPVYWIAKSKITSKYIALFFPVAYLLYPPLQRMVLYDFHAVALSTTFLLLAYWYMEKEKYVWFGIFATLAALGKEEVWLVTGLFGFYIAWKKGKKWIGLATLFISGIIFYALFWKIIPAHAIAQQHFALAYLSEFGNSPDGVLKNILVQPMAVLRSIFLPDRLFYYFLLLFPVGFFPVFAPAALFFALPDLLINSLSSNGLMRTINYQYTSNIIPFIFISAIAGYNALQHMISSTWHKRLFLGLGISALCISIWAWGELPYGRDLKWWFYFMPKPEKDVMQQVEKMTDSKYSVSATNNIGAHFSQRQFLYNYPIHAQEADVVVIELGDPHAWPNSIEQQRVLDDLMKNMQYTLIAHTGNFYAFKKVGI
jgi:uncharacterized membrane protein